MHTLKRLRAALVAVAIFAASLVLLGSPPASAASYTLTVDNATLNVLYMGGPISTERLQWLIQTADRSTCTTNPVGVSCNGLMDGSSGGGHRDTIVIGDNYMAWLDMTENLNVDYGNGGGGLLRGFWLLTGSGETKNFAYIMSGGNFAPNNLYPCQMPDAPCGGDGYELLVSPSNGSGAEAPDKTYRASDSSDASIVEQTYAADSDPYYSIRVTGTMSKFNGATNAATPNQGTSRLFYNLYYRFYNNDHPAGSASSRFAIGVRATIDVCGTGCNAPTRPLDTAVFSLGLSKNPISSIPFMDDTMKMDNFLPVTDALLDQGGNGNCDDQNPAAACAAGTSYQDVGHGVHEAVTNNPFGIRLASQPPGSTSANLRVAVSDSSITSYPGPPILAGKVYHQYFNDTGNGLYVYDMKAGDPNQGGGALGSLSQNQSIAFAHTLGWQY